MTGNVKNDKLSLPTKKIGCFKANFSTPPLMTLVLRVRIPAWHNGIQFGTRERLGIGEPFR